MIPALSTYHWFTGNIGISFLTRLFFAFISSFVCTWLMHYWAIPKLKAKNWQQSIREKGPKSHLADKQGTPTMGGFMMISCIILLTMFFSDINNPYVITSILNLALFSAIGLRDDWLKIKKNNASGISAKLKSGLQILCSVLVLLTYQRLAMSSDTMLFSFPGLPNAFHLGWFFIPFASFVLIASSNALNLTDGLDGLATLPTFIISLGLALVVYAMTTASIAFAHHFPFHPALKETIIIAACMMGCCLGFLWFNSFPASIFMGDAGSLALGAQLGLMGIMTQQPFLLMIMSGVLVCETLSVIIQVSSFKITGKRVFKMAPIHHHFELSGLHETKITIRCLIITILLVSYALFLTLSH
jgi:phospho-N-acetylmuramoyl-pentapeptide-transferase